MPLEWNIWFYIVWAIMYASTIVVSALGSIPILTTKAWNVIFLTIFAVYHYLNLSNHPASESYIWNLNNWLIYPFRRLIVEILIGFLNPLT